MTLQLLDLSSSLESLVSLELLESTLVVECIIQKLFVSLSFLLLSLLSELLFGGIVLDELQVSLTVQQESILSVFLLLLFLNLPLSLEHALFLFDKFSLLLSLELSCLFLPVKNGHGVSNFILLLLGLLHLSFELLLCIKLPQLSIHLLLNHSLLNVSSLVNQLLLALDGSSEVVELSVLLSE